MKRQVLLLTMLVVACGRVGVVGDGRLHDFYQDVPFTGPFFVEAGSGTACTNLDGGTLTCWGSNRFGMVWDAPPGDFVRLSLRFAEGCGLRVDGSVVCWGAAWPPHRPQPQGAFLQVDNSHQSCGLRDDGRVVCWNIDPTKVTHAFPTEPLKMIAVGESHGCGVRDDDTLECWPGCTSCGGVPTWEFEDDRLSPPIGAFRSVVAGGAHNCAIRLDGRVICWGDNTHGQTLAPDDRFVELSAADNSTCGLRRDQSITCWGDTFPGLARHAPEERFVHISLAPRLGCGVDSDQRVVCWADRSSSFFPFEVPSDLR